MHSMIIPAVNPEHSMAVALMSFGVTGNLSASTICQAEFAVSSSSPDVAFVASAPRDGVGSFLGDAGFDVAGDVAPIDSSTNVEDVDPLDTVPSGKSNTVGLLSSGSVGFG